MTYYPYFFVSIGLLLICILDRSHVLQRKNMPVELYISALKEENNGHFEQAVIKYEFALSEVKKIRFNSSLKNKIIEKLKVLHTNISYKNSPRIIRYRKVRIREMWELSNIIKRSYHKQGISSCYI